MNGFYYHDLGNSKALMLFGIAIYRQVGSMVLIGIGNYIIYRRVGGIKSLFGISWGK